jgi:hypothetical protein
MKAHEKKAEPGRRRRTHAPEKKAAQEAGGLQVVGEKRHGRANWASRDDEM